jgi:hypothetical protein
MTSLKPNIKRGTAILIDVNNKLRKLTASYKKISKAIIYVDLSTFYDFVNAYSYLKNANLRMCELMLSFTNSLRQANGLPEAEIRDPVDEDPTAGDEVQDVLQEGEQFADNAPLPPPSDEGDPNDDDPTDAEEEEGQELEDVAVPQGAPVLVPQTSVGTSGTTMSSEMDTDEMADDPFQVLFGELEQLGTPDALRLSNELLLIAQDVSKPIPDAGMADKAYINSFNRTLQKIRKVLNEVGNFEEEIDEIRARFTKLMAQNTIPSGIQSLVDKTRETASPEEIRALDKILGAYMRKKTKAREQKLIQYMLDRQSAQDAQDRATDAFEAEQKRFRTTFI